MSPVGWLLSQCDKLIDMTMSLFTVISLVLCHFGHTSTQYYCYYYCYIVAKPFKKTTHTNTTKKNYGSENAIRLFVIFAKTCIGGGIGNNEYAVNT